MARIRTNIQAARPRSGLPGNRLFAGGRTFVVLSTLLFLVVTGVFLRAVRSDFVNYDDQVYVTANAHVQDGLSRETLKWAFRSVEGANWHPLTLLSHAFDCQVFGLKAWGHHLTSILLHAINSVLLFTILLRMTGAIWRSLFVALLFSLHPLRVESVAWVAERKDVLGAMFWLLALLAYVRYVAESNSDKSRAGSDKSRAGVQSPKSKGRNAKSKVFYGLALVAFVLGLMSKPMLVTLPFVLLLLDWWPLGRISNFEFRSSNSDAPSTINHLSAVASAKADQPPVRRSLGEGGSTLRWLLLEKVPFFLLAAAVSVVTLLIQRKAGAMERLAHLQFPDRFANALVAYVRYLGKTFYPADLSVYYPHPGQWPMALVIFSGVLLLALSIAALVFGRRFPFVPAGWFWFVGTLVPVIGLVQVGGQSIADRYTYIPSMGLFIALVWGACELARRRPQWPALLPATAALVAIVSAMLTWRQAGVWRNSGTLFRQAVATTKNNPIAWFHLGDYHMAQYQFGQAADMYREAIRISPDYPDAHNNLGAALLYQRHVGEAIVELERAIQLKPNYTDAHNNLGAALESAGRIEEALQHFARAVEIEPEVFQPRMNLGNSLAAQGRLDEAFVHLQAAVQLRPTSPEAHCSLGTVLAGKGHREEAIAEFREALRLQPDYPDATNRLRALQASPPR